MERLTFQSFIKQWWLRQLGKSDEVVKLRVAEQRIKNGYEVDAQTKLDLTSLHEQDALYKSYASDLASIPLLILQAIMILLGIAGLIYGVSSFDSINPVGLSIIIGAIIIAIAIKSKK